MKMEICINLLVMLQLQNLNFHIVCALPCDRGRWFAEPGQFSVYRNRLKPCFGSTQVFDNNLRSSPVGWKTEAHLKQTLDSSGGSWQDGWIIWKVLNWIICVAAFNCTSYSVLICKVNPTTSTVTTSTTLLSSPSSLTQCERYYRSLLRRWMILKWALTLLTFTISLVWGKDLIIY